MKYIIMCGGNYPAWETPRQLTPILGEPIVARTIRFLRFFGAEDIAISTHDERFEKFGVPLLKHTNEFIAYSGVKDTQHWVDAFYPTEEPACYIMGDVVFSQEAIRTIVEEEPRLVQFFASAPPFSEEYIKPYAEPFAFKVNEQAFFKSAISFVRENENLFYRWPIAWELWQVLKGTPLNLIDYTNYRVINDYTCDIDAPEDAQKIEAVLQKRNGGKS